MPVPFSQQNPAFDWDQWAKDQPPPESQAEQAEHDERIASEAYWERVEEGREWERERGEWESDLEMARRQKGQRPR